MRILFFFKNGENLGIEYLSSFLKQNGHETGLIFDPSADDIGINLFSHLSRLNRRAIFTKIFKFKPNLVAFSVYTNLFQWVIECAKFIKKYFDIPIVVGGPHVSIVPEIVIKKLVFDYLIIGEGEVSIVRLVDALESKCNLSEVPNLWYRENGNIFKNPIAPLIQNLDTIPFPDKELFYKYGAFKHRYYIMASRGCPMSCSYCINHQIHHLYPDSPMVRKRSVENVLEEIRIAKHKFNIDSLYFCDDNFILESKWLREFGLKYSNSQINLPFKILVHPANVIEWKINYLRSIGCDEIDMGIESGNEELREKVFHRKVSNKQIISAAKIIKKAGIRLTTLNMINIPDETPDRMLETLNLNRKINPAGVQITSLYPYPNTDIARFCLENGYMDEKILQMTYHGYGNYRKQSILKHPYKEFGEKIRIYGPIFLKLPERFEFYLFLFPIIKIVDLIHLIFGTTIQNAILKIREYLVMIRKSESYYRSNKFLED